MRLLITLLAVIAVLNLPAQSYDKTQYVLDLSTNRIQGYSSPDRQTYVYSPQRSSEATRSPVINLNQIEVIVVNPTPPILYVPSNYLLFQDRYYQNTLKYIVPQGYGTGNLWIY